MIELGSDGWRDCGGTTATGMWPLPVVFSEALEERLGKSQREEEEEGETSTMTARVLIEYVPRIGAIGGLG